MKLRGMFGEWITRSDEVAADVEKTTQSLMASAEVRRWKNLGMYVPRDDQRYDDGRNWACVKHGPF